MDLEVLEDPVEWVLEDPEAWVREEWDPEDSGVPEEPHPESSAGPEGSEDRRPSEDPPRTHPHPLQAASPRWT